MIVPCLCTILIVVILIVVVIINIIIIVIVVRVGCGGCDCVDVIVVVAVSSFVIALETLIEVAAFALVLLDSSDTIDGITHIDLDVL